MDYKTKFIVTIILIVIEFGIIFLLINVINDLTATANGYKSDRNVCRMEQEELINNYEKLEKECNEISKGK